MNTKKCIKEPRENQEDYSSKNKFALGQVNQQALRIELNMFGQEQVNKNFLAANYSNRWVAFNNPQLVMKTIIILQSISLTQNAMKGQSVQNNKNE